MKIEKKKKGNTNENADKLNATLCTARDEKVNSTNTTK